MMIPPRFADHVFEIPAFAMFPAEIALVMMLSVLFFENATPAELLRVSFTMLAICMFAGGMGNIFGKTSQTLPDQTLLLNWIQLICMNITGLISTIAFYQTKAPQLVVKQAPIKEVPAVKPPEVVPNEPPKLEEKGESVQEILDKLDISRITRLEKSLKKPEEQGNVSLESLFADESSDVGQKKISARTTDEIDMSTASLDELLGGAGDSGNISKLDLTPHAEPVEKTPEPPVEAKPVEAKPVEPKPEVAAEVKEESLAEIKARIAAMAPPPDTAAPAAPTESKSTLFDDASLGGDLEDIFADLAGGNANDDVTPEKLAEIKSTAPPPAEPAPVEAKADSKLMDVSDNDIDDIFSNLVAEDAEKQVGDILEEVAPPTPPSQPAPAAASSSSSSSSAPSHHPNSSPREVKEFGRLSAAATSKTEPVAPGTLKTIGQMLLDTQAVENIIKHSEAKGDKEVKQSAATARVVTVSRGADIQAMLDRISEFPGIDGSLVIGKDGLLIGSTQSLGMMRDVYGVLSLGVHSTTNLGTKKVDLGELKQSVMRCGNKFTVMTEIGIGVLASFGDNWDVSQIDRMLDHISKSVNASQASGGASLPMETLSGGLLSEESSAPAAVATAPVAETPPVVAEPEPEIDMGGDEVIPITEMKGGLLNVDDDDIGGLFDNVLADPTVQNDAIADGKPAEPAAPAAAAAVSVPSAPDLNKPLISVNDDDVSNLFDDLMDKADSDLSKELASDLSSMDFSPAAAATPAASGEKPSVEPKPEDKPAPKPDEKPAAEPGEPEKPVAPAEPPKKPQAPSAAPTNQIKEFGRLSAGTSAQAESQGAIKAIGRQLIDVQAVENIIKSGEKREKMGAGLTTARVISAARGEGIKALLTKIDGHPGVAGSLIVGNDGLVIASTLKGGLDKDLLGALCSAMHSHTDLAGKKLNMGKMRQIIFHASDKVTVLTAVAVGVLAVFVENSSLSELDSLLTAIEGTVRG
jgi:predicted regulator of Ras-like GTPase activity (Roadblock/LC7/MglB family)